MWYLFDKCHYMLTIAFNRDDIKHLFDRLLPGIDSLIDKQLKLLSETRSDAEVVGLRTAIV